MISVLIWAEDFTLKSFYVICLELTNDMTMATVAYDRQTAAMYPEKPTVVDLLTTSTVMAVSLTLSTLGLFYFGPGFLDSRFEEEFLEDAPTEINDNRPYQQACLFLQISIMTALLILSLRTRGLMFLSRPSVILLTAVFSIQIIVSIIVGQVP